METKILMKHNYDSLCVCHECFCKTGKDKVADIAISLPDVNKDKWVFTCWQHFKEAISACYF